MERVEALEERIAALERTLEDGKKSTAYIVDTWQKVILQFAKDFHIDTPELQDVSDMLKQKESHF